jgi:hypothetical protein
MEHAKDKREELLLDWHLRRLGEPERSWIEQELQRDADLRKKSDHLGRVLQPLDCWQGPPCPPNLPEKTMAFVHGATRAPVLSMAPVADSSGGRGPFFRWRDLVAAAACIVVLVGAMVPGMSIVRGRAQQAQCAGNLASIFRGLGTYQAMFDGSLPYAGQPALAAWLPTAAGHPFRSNSRHLFRLVKLACGTTPTDFICPSDPHARPMPVKDMASYDDFACATNISYDSLNLTGARPNVRPAVPLVYVGDANPLFVGARFNGSIDPDKTNSPAHGGRGQNALTTGGQALFMRTPFYGAQNDNVWLAGSIRQYTGTESPVSDEDAQLVPGCPDSAATQSISKY